MEHSQNGFWIAMPSVKGKDGKNNDQVFPLSNEAIEELTAVILKEYGNKSGETSDNTSFNNTGAGEGGFAAIEGDDDIPF